MSLTVHLVFNAHLDPVWLWPWTAGLDEALATCRSACDRLDAHPELVFTRGEAWVYRQVEQCDPELFERIRGHVDAGRWEIVGGWWIQPDCNGPSAWAMDWQVCLGREFFEDRFGVFPRIAYNVDSFGHSAHLPALMRSHGQDRYVMMRPQEHELDLPARFFRWRGYEDGPEVTTFRIASAYTVSEITLEHILDSLEDLPAGFEHTMCFVGVGDHGGGPTEEQIEWCLANRDRIPGVRLEFSSPSRFFDAIEPQIGRLPLVVGELQQHSIGCYSVYRPIKTSVRRAEHRLRQAEIAAPSASLQSARQRVCFAHFHDTYGGTCLPSAYPAILDQVGGATADADEAMQLAFRRKLSELPPDPSQRIVAFNASDQPFTGYTTHDPWLDWERWEPSWCLVDDDGRAVAVQQVRSEAALQDVEFGMPRILFHVSIPPGQMRTWRLGTAGAFTDVPGPVLTLPKIRFELYDDATDTWSHRIDRYPATPCAVATERTSILVADGPLMTARHQSLSVSDTLIEATWRAYASEPGVELDLTIDWRERHRLLKLVMEPAASWSRRLDGVMGGSLARPLDGRELPLRDWTLLDRYGVVCPDVYAMDVTPRRARFTLLRSPQMAHHAPHAGFRLPPIEYSDRGTHRFRFRFVPDADASTLDRQATMLHRPLLLADLTRGMSA